MKIPSIPKSLLYLLSHLFQVPSKDLPRVLLHALLLCCLLSSFWLLDALKDPVLSAVIGIDRQPTAKLLSVLVTFFVVFLYDKLTSFVSKSSLFYFLSIFFGTVFFVISALLSNEESGLNNHEKSDKRWVGWISYFAIEAYGSLMVALFWSFTNSIMNLEQAKGAYGLIISFAQVGAILGSTLATQDVGIPQLYLLGALIVYFVSILIKLYHIVFRDKLTVEMEMTRVRSTTESSISSSSVPTEGEEEGENNTSFAHKFAVMFEGISLIYSHRYVLYLLLVTCLYEIVITILDFEFKVMAAAQSSAVGAEGSESDGNDSFVNLLGHFGQMTNVLSLFVAIIGFSFLVRKLGVRYTLLIFPLIMFTAVVMTNLVPSFWLLFVLVSVLKAFDYSLYDPAIELLYIPTSEPIKFKAKAWIDVFGARVAKAIGSIITNLASGDMSRLRRISEMPMIVISLFLLAVAYVVGRDFEQLVRDDIVVGEDPEETKLRKLNKGLKENSELQNLPTRNGLNPGDVGYDGYDLALWEDEDFLSDSD